MAEIDHFKDKLPDVSSIVPKNSLFDDGLKSVIIETIIDLIKKHPEYSKYRTSFELIKYAVNLVENLVTDRKSGAMKKDIIQIVFQKVFNLNPNEMKLLSDTIEDLKNNKHIKKIRIKKKYVYPALRWLKKKLI
jgi:hypothetical protein